MLIEIVKRALMITGFVFVMMLVIEYLNVLTSGAWQARLARYRWGQYVVAAVLGAIPGCLGAFAVVAMYSHRILTLGAVVAAMVATSGDEAFVMLAMIPKKGLLVFGIIFVLGILAGALTDIMSGRRKTSKPVICEGFELHAEEQCNCFPRGQILRQWKECSAARGVLATFLMLCLIALITGQVGPPTWEWIRVTLSIVSAIALFIVCTVPDHFLEEHLWEHVARKHIPRVLFWTFGALIVMYVLTDYLHLEDSLEKGKWILLLIACLVGIIPESGPHLVFVTLYAQGTIPLSILLASSIVQDGHGMLPMLAHSRRAFLGIKGINFVIGLIFGGLLMTMGY